MWANWGKRRQSWGVPILAHKSLIFLSYMGEEGSAPGVIRTPDLLISIQTLLLSVQSAS